MEITDITSHSEAEDSWNVAALAAYRRVERESRATITRIAAAMGMTESGLKRIVQGGERWSLNAVLRLAVATSQDPIEMLARKKGKD